MLAARPLYTPTESPWQSQTQAVRPSTRQVAVENPSKERLKWIATILLCTVVVCLMIGQFSNIARSNIEVEQLKIQVEEQTEKNAKLSDQVNELSSPTRIMDKARQMGMVSTNPGVVARAGKE